nr:MAG TPA: hypothetical protein [Caudoviricetes sp.]
MNLCIRWKSNSRSSHSPLCCINKARNRGSTILGEVVLVNIFFCLKIRYGYLLVEK